MSWRHPQLGSFEFDIYWWVQEREISAFRGFTFSLQKQPGQGLHHLGFDAEDEGDFPSRAAAAMAVKVVGAIDRLVPMAIGALWTDLSGAGVDSGMWWNGALARASNGKPEELTGMLSELGYKIKLPRLTSPTALNAWLQPKSVRIRQKTFRHKQPVAELCFEAGFDPEHGVGILTDGTRILGIGYSGETELFETE